MKKIFNTILLLFIILGNVTAQNKKELNALVSKLRVDSASMKDEIKVLNSSISKLENDLILKKSQLSKKSIKIESLVSKNEKLKHSFDTSFKSNLFLRNQIHTQIIKYDSLKSQLELLQTNKVICNVEDLSQEIYYEVIEAYIDNEKTVSTCEYRNIRIVTSTEVSDYRGYLERNQILYLKIDKKYLQVDNSQIFNTKQINLINKINNLIKEDYKNYFDESSHCFDFLPEDLNYDINELEISISNDGINFFADWNLYSACISVDDGSTIWFTFDQISEYFNKAVYKN